MLPFQFGPHAVLFQCLECRNLKHLARYPCYNNCSFVYYEEFGYNLQAMKYFLAAFCCCPCSLLVLSALETVKEFAASDQFQP